LLYLEDIIKKLIGGLKMNIKKISWGLIILMVIINIGFYPFIPAKMAIHFNSSGADRFVIKEIGLLILPVIAAILSLVNSSDETKAPRTLLINILLFVVNIFGNIMNVR
jgi:uncharacterized membrane protein